MYGHLLVESHCEWTGGDDLHHGAVVVVAIVNVRAVLQVKMGQQTTGGTRRAVSGDATRGAGSRRQAEPKLFVGETYNE